MSAVEIVREASSLPAPKKKVTSFEIVPFGDLKDPIKALRQITRHLRKSDMDEVRGIAGSMDYKDLAYLIAGIPGFKFVAMNPILQTYYGVGGFTAVRMGVFEGWILGTNNFQKAYIPLTRAIKRDIIPAIIAGGAHRLECKSVATHEEAHKWLEVMGAKYEGTHYGYGMNGEDFKTYAWRF